MNDDWNKLLISLRIQHRSGSHSRRLPPPAAPLEFLRAHSNGDLRGALEARDHVKLRADSLVQNPWQVTVSRSRSGSSHLERSARLDDLVHALQAGMAHDIAARRALDRRADPVKLSRVQSDGLVAKRLVKNIGAIPYTYKRSVTVGLVISVVRRDEASGAVHVVHYECRVAGNVFPDMTCYGSRIGVVAAAGGKANSDPNRLPRIKIVSRGAGRVVKRQQSSRGYR